MKTEHKSFTNESVRDLWQTPQLIFDYYDNRFNFTLDMAASEHNALCSTFVSEDDDCLNEASFYDKFFLTEFVQKHGAAWINPPYSNITPWVEMAIRRSRECRSPIVMLIPADTSVKWFKLAYENCTECHLISGRISFINAETKKPVNGNNKGSVIFIFDPLSPVKQSVHLIDRDELMGISN